MGKEKHKVICEEGMKMPNIAIITARGGSKRIPKKNIKNFCGRPIIAYSIEAALNSNIFDEVMVSTDSEEIADIARSYGAQIPFFRSKGTSNDFASTSDVIEEVLEEYKKLDRTFKYFACIYPTAPFVTEKHLVKAFAMLKEADAVLSVVKYSFPPQRAFVLRDNNVVFQYPEFEKTRSQDLEPIYHDCGQFYMCSSKKFQEHHSLLLPVTMPYIMPEEEVQDIDTMSDWEIAEAKYKVLHRESL